MLLDETGLKMASFDPVLAAVLGNAKGEEGANVLDEARRARHGRVQLRDWLYCLARAPGTEVRKQLIDNLNKVPEKFIALVEDSVDTAGEPEGLPPLELKESTAAPAVQTMLQAAERLARSTEAGKVTDAVLTLALLEAARGDGLIRLLAVWASEDRLKTFEARLRGKLPPKQPVKVFTDAGDLSLAIFAPSGKKFCRRLAEDAASLGSAKVTTRHLLYTLLGNESGVLTLALAARGVDVKRELHAALTRELARPGKKRNPDFQLTRETVFKTVEEVVKQAHALAGDRGGTGVREFDLGRAFLAKQAPELTRLFAPQHPLDLTALRDYVDSSEPDEEEEQREQRFPVAEIQGKIKDRICGQEAAIDRVIPWVKRLRFGLPRDGRPAAVFLFLGPTGAGKTQLAKELARYVFGDEEKMIFLEMGQFKTKESMSGFIGAPPGYIGYGEGKLTNGLRDKPESVVLFDEIEKADTQVFDTLLRFADEGVISDPAGPVRDGRKCIIVMTTNAGQTWLRDHLKANPEVRQDPAPLAGQLFDEAMKELQQRGFRPEFLGRVDERITFLPFTLATCRKIVDGVLGRELKKFQDLKGITLEVPGDVRDFLAAKAYERSSDEGARGAPRAANEYIITPAIDILTSAGGEDGSAAITHLEAYLRGLDTVELCPKGNRPAGPAQPVGLDMGKTSALRINP